jgi:hypothetical protein
MNIFWLSKSLRRCARYYCNKHCIKIILEITQVLFCAHHVISAVSVDTGEYWAPILPSGARPYRKTHANHPVSVWARARLGNYRMACRMGLELCREYTYRYGGKVHKCESLLRALNERPPPAISIDTVPSIPPLCMPDQYKTECNSFDDVVRAYRKYYINEKRALLQYVKRPAPKWLCGVTR